MKKNFVKKLALGLALVMAVTSVPASSEAAATPGFKSSAVKVRVGQTKKYSTENSKKYSVKFKIGNKKVATIKYTAGSKSVKVTGVAEGKTTLRADFKSYSTKKVTTAKVPVTVLAAKEEAPVVTEATMTGVTQTSANTFRVTFAADASKKYANATDYAVEAADGSKVLAVKSVEFAADGLTAELTTYHTFADGVTYNVICGGKTVNFVASVGAVAKVVVYTASAQQNVETPISFKLFDATGMDVTDAIDLDAYCTVLVSGDYTASNVARASKASVTMSTPGNQAVVEVIYNNNIAGTADVVSAPQTITCIAATAVKGTASFVELPTAVNTKSGAAKFYMGLSDKLVDVDVNGTATFDFCAKEDAFSAVYYDAYEVESSNEDVATVNVVKGTGKYATIQVSGVKVGTAQVSIKATKNGIPTYYNVPVVVEQAGKATSMAVTIDKPVLSNVEDTDYFATITVTMKDSQGNTIPVAAKSLELIGAENVVTPVAISGTANVTAWDAVARTYTIKVTADADDGYNTHFEKNVNIQVKDLYAGKTKGDALNLTYQVEVGTSLDENPGLVTAKANPGTTTARLYATNNGLFAGYVRATGVSTVDVANGNVTATTPTAISTASVQVVFGTQYVDATTPATRELYKLVPATGTTSSAIDANGKIAITTVTTGQCATASFAGITTNGKTVYAAGSKDLAKTGNYTLKYNLVVGDTTKLVKSANINVKNTVVLPKVDVTSRIASTVAVNGTIIEDCLRTNVDMNNDISNHESILELVGSYSASTGYTAATTDATGLKTSVKYVVVEDGNWVYFVPYGATFRAE